MEPHIMQASYAPGSPNPMIVTLKEFKKATKKLEEDVNNVVVEKKLVEARTSRNADIASVHTENDSLNRIVEKRVVPFRSLKRNERLERKHYLI